MAEQVLIQFRADKELKQEVAEIYERLGMDLPTLSNQGVHCYACGNDGNN